MDVSGIDMTVVELFDAGYWGAKCRYGVLPESAPARMQKKIRKFVTRHYLKGERFPKRVLAYIDKTAKDDAFIEFLSACHHRVVTEGDRAQQHFQRVTEHWPKDAQYALEMLLDTQHWVEDIFQQVGEDVHCKIDTGGGYDLTLIFHNANGVPKKYDSVSFQKQAIAPQENGFCLVGETEHWDEDIIKPFVLRFTHVTANVQVFSATGTVFFLSPWETIIAVMRNILEKSKIPGEYCNGKEKELLPLFGEMVRLSFQWYPFPSESDEGTFTLFKELALQMGCDGLVPLLEQLEKTENLNKKDRLSRKIMWKLNHKEYEPLWRELYHLVERSQAGYPSRSESADVPRYLQKARTLVQQQMEANGYSGTYPDFVKSGSMKKLHFAQSYGTDYIVGWEKQVAYHIHCHEEIRDSTVEISFLCGTHFLKKGGASQDAYTCTFNDKGHRLFTTVTYVLEHKQDVDILEQGAQIAIKKAQLQRLTKEEKNSLVSFRESALKAFLLIFLGMGGLFAAMFTPAMMGVAALFTWLDGMPVVFFEPFWWWIFLFAWVGFGLPMAIIRVFSKRK